MASLSRDHTCKNSYWSGRLSQGINFQDELYLSLKAQTKIYLAKYDRRRVTNSSAQRFLVLGNTSLGQAHDSSFMISVVYTHTNTKKEKTRTQKGVICVNSNLVSMVTVADTEVTYCKLVASNGHLGSFIVATN